MPPGHPLGIPSSQVLPAFSGEPDLPSHHQLRNIFIKGARDNRILMHKTSGEVSLGYERRALAAARFAAEHHRLGLVEIKAKLVKASEANLPADEQRGVFQAVRK